MNKTLAISCLLVCCIAVPAQAGQNNKYHSKHHQQHNRNNDYFYDFAKVSSVTPIVEVIEHRVPVQCHHTRYYQSASDRQSATPMILGTIIGAAIGNKLGHNKSNKRVGAVAGGILGASIGSNIGADISSKAKHDSRQDPCQNQYEIEYEEQVVGYNVKYRYRGKTYSTRTSEHPGNRIQMKLQFQPVIS